MPCEQGFCDSALQKLQIERWAMEMATQLKVKINCGGELVGRVGMFPGFRLCTVAGGKVYTKMCTRLPHPALRQVASGHFSC